MGLYEFQNGVTYAGIINIIDKLGSWNNESPNGYGKESYLDGGYYEGLFVNGMK